MLSVVLARKFKEDDKIEFTWFSYDKQTASCKPTWPCKFIDIDTIPYLVNHISLSFLEDHGNLYDQLKTQQCLSNHKILMLGDSQMEELMFDLVILLGGIGKSYDNLLNFIQTVLSEKNFLEDHTIFDNFGSNNDLMIDEYWGRRNVTIVSAENEIRIRHRFTGHVTLMGNNMGMDTFFDPRFQDELSCLLGFPKGDFKEDCERPDVIIVNSGLHDPYEKSRDLLDFKRKVANLVELFETKYSEGKAVRIIWKGNLEWHLEHFNKAAKEIVEDAGFEFLNITYLNSYIPNYESNFGDYSPDGKHFGSIGRMHRAKSLGTLSMLITQSLLQLYCKED